MCGGPTRPLGHHPLPRRRRMWDAQPTCEEAAGRRIGWPDGGRAKRVCASRAHRDWIAARGWFGPRVDRLAPRGSRSAAHHAVQRLAGLAGQPAECRVALSCHFARTKHRPASRWVGRENEGAPQLGRLRDPTRLQATPTPSSCLCAARPAASRTRNQTTRRRAPPDALRAADFGGRSCRAHRPALATHNVALRAARLLAPEHSQRLVALHGRPRGRDSEGAAPLGCMRASLTQPFDSSGGL